MDTPKSTSPKLYTPMSSSNSNSPPKTFPCVENENTITASNPHTHTHTRTHTQRHIQSLPSFENLKTGGHVHVHIHREPTTIQQTKDAVLKQEMLENIKQKTKAFYLKTHAKPPLQPMPSHAPPTLPSEFNFATRRRAMSRDKVADTNRRHTSRQHTHTHISNIHTYTSRTHTPHTYTSHTHTPHKHTPHTCTPHTHTHTHTPHTYPSHRGYRSRSATPSNRGRNRSASPMLSGENVHHGRMHIRKVEPVAMDDKITQSLLKRPPLTEPKPFALSCNSNTMQFKQEHDLYIKQETTTDSAEDKIPSKTLTSHRSLTAPQNIALNTEARVAVWQQRRQIREEKEQQKRVAKQKEDDEREAMLKLEAQAPPIKANAMPVYPAPPMPAKSSKPLTQPMAPRFVSLKIDKQKQKQK